MSCDLEDIQLPQFTEIFLQARERPIFSVLIPFLWLHVTILLRDFNKYVTEPHPRTAGSDSPGVGTGNLFKEKCLITFDTTLETRL